MNGSVYYFTTVSEAKWCDLVARRGQNGHVTPTSPLAGVLTGMIAGLIIAVVVVAAVWVINRRRATRVARAVVTKDTVADLRDTDSVDLHKAA